MNTKVVANFMNELLEKFQILWISSLGETCETIRLWLLKNRFYREAKDEFLTPVNVRFSSGVEYESCGLSNSESTGKI